MNNKTSDRPHTPRTRRLVQPGFQLRLMARFVGLAVGALALQALVITFWIVRAASGLGPDGASVAGLVPGMMLQVFAITFSVLVPLMALVGIILTHKTAGPLYRMRQYLLEVAEGVESQPMQTRRGDELEELTEAMNAAVAPLLEANAKRQEPDDGTARAAA